MGHDFLGGMGPVLPHDGEKETNPYEGYPEDMKPEKCDFEFPKKPQGDKCNWQDQMKNWLEQIKNWYKAKKDCDERNRDKAKKRENFV